MQKQQLILTTLLSFNDLLTYIYNSKFKGKQHLAQLLNNLTQYSILSKPTHIKQNLDKQSSNQMEIFIYDVAKTNCLKAIVNKMVDYQKYVEKYIECSQKMMKMSQTLVSAKPFIQNQIRSMSLKIHQQKAFEMYTQIQFMTEITYLVCLLQLMQIVINLSNQYMLQKELLVRQSECIKKLLFKQGALQQQFDSYKTQDNKINKATLSQVNLPQLTKQLQTTLLHIVYQTKVQNHLRQEWNQKLSLLNNKKYNR